MLYYSQSILYLEKLGGILSPPSPRATRGFGKPSPSCAWERCRRRSPLASPRATPTTVRPGLSVKLRPGSLSVSSDSHGAPRESMDTCQAVLRHSL